MNPYRAGDGHWFFFTGLEAARHIGAVCRALGRPELLDDPRFADAGVHPAQPDRGHRHSGRDHRPASPWRCGPSASTTRASGGRRRRRRPRSSTDPQLLANDGIVEIDGGDDGHVQRRSTGRSASPTWPVAAGARFPRSGQHTEEVLRELSERRGHPCEAAQPYCVGPGQQARGR